MLCLGLQWQSNFLSPFPMSTPGKGRKDGFVFPIGNFLQVLPLSFLAAMAVM